MGVPKFYRWISERYPQINQLICEASLLPEFDNFYLDMNGIIHACTHPTDNDVSKSLTTREMMLAIFRYIDRMVTEIVKPKKILFMAIDGVAPRAKLNQQRARRFRAAQERMENVNKARQKGETVDENAMFDSNCITPGTEFMEVLNKHLRWFIRKKIKEDPIWRNLEIVFSGHDVPGEGEHKIMQFIREARAKPGYQPNQRHCMYGQDADLIMLGLATHEPHFALLREVVNFNMNNSSSSARQTVIRQTREVQFQLLHLTILREYIELDLALGCNRRTDKERLIDDFIFLTFIIGNDFLPHLPTLDIGEHAFDVIFQAYKDLLTISPGYIVENGEISDIARLEQLFDLIGDQEVSILQAREDDMRYLCSKKRGGRNDRPQPTQEELEEIEEAQQEAYEAAIQSALEQGEVDEVDSNEDEDEDDDDDDEELADESDELRCVTSDEDAGGYTIVTKTVKKTSKKTASAAATVVIDSESAKDYRGRYYFEKFRVVGLDNSVKGRDFLHSLKQNYLQGLMWCLAYYIKGCISWTWYYPYHYGPMLLDMKNIDRIIGSIEFSLGKPFQPFQQLLGCLPPASRTLIPKPYQWIMTSQDSPVIEFYPEDFQVDQGFKKNPWEAVVLLSFIDEKKLLEAERLHCPSHLLTSDEIARNKFGSVLRYEYDPTVLDTYFSCNPEIGLADVSRCHSRMTEESPSLAPGAFFKPTLVPGTVEPIAGFPTMGVLPMKKVTTESIKVNVFGSESKYKSLLLELAASDCEALKAHAKLLIGRSVFVNYPSLLEARVVAVSMPTEEYRVSQPVNTISLPSTEAVEHVVYDEVMVNKWRTESEAEALSYLKGRGTPGSGGLVIGQVQMRLRVCVLQGMRLDSRTGARHKVFGTGEADIPLQLALWAPRCVDSRFQETEALPLHQLMPLGCEVIAVAEPLIGYKGRVVGPHSATASAKQSSNKTRTVDVEFTVMPQEPPFGYAIAASIKDQYFSSRDMCRSLNISPSVLGKIVGSVPVDPGRLDVGLNLKRNGQYALLGYVRKSDANATSDFAKPAWTLGDSVQIIGSTTNFNTPAANEAEVVNWEYSTRAITLIFDFKTQFPNLFHNLTVLPHQKFYTAEQLLGSGEELKRLMDWMKEQPFFAMHRTPLTTMCLSRDAMTAIERAADVRVSHLSSLVTAEETGSSTLTAATGRVSVKVIKGVPVENLFRSELHGTNDAPLTYNSCVPRLGDRIINLAAIGVPVGLRGTVIAIHTATCYVEVIFDEEFVGGKSLQGFCSQFRGRLCAWAGLLRTSTDAQWQSLHQRSHAAAGQALSSSPMQSASIEHSQHTSARQQQATAAVTTKVHTSSANAGTKNKSTALLSSCLSVATSSGESREVPASSSSEKRQRNITQLLKRTVAEVQTVATEASAEPVVSCAQKEDSPAPSGDKAVKSLGKNITLLLRHKLDTPASKLSANDVHVPAAKATKKITHLLKKSAGSVDAEAVADHQDNTDSQGQGKAAAAAQQRAAIATSGTVHLSKASVQILQKKSAPSVFAELDTTASCERSLSELNLGAKSDGTGALALAQAASSAPLPLAPAQSSSSSSTQSASASKSSGFVFHEHTSSAAAKPAAHPPLPSLPKKLKSTTAVKPVKMMIPTKILSSKPSLLASSSSSSVAAVTTAAAWSAPAEAVASSQSLDQAAATSSPPCNDQLVSSDIVSAALSSSAAPAADIDASNENDGKVAAAPKASMTVAEKLANAKRQMLANKAKGSENK